MIEAIGAILVIIGAWAKWYFDKDRQRGVALKVKKEHGKEAQKEIDEAIKNKDYIALSAVMQRLHDNRRGLPEKANSTSNNT